MLVNAGCGNRILDTEVVAVLSPGSAPLRHLKDDARERNRPTGAARGRLTTSIPIVAGGHGIPSEVQVKTLTHRRKEGDRQ